MDKISFGRKYFLSGEDGRVTITANWGLGETVVSGNVEPDTVIVSADTNTVIDKMIGSKLVRLLYILISFYVNFQLSFMKARYF